MLLSQFSPRIRPNLKNPGNHDNAWRVEGKCLTGPNATSSVFLSVKNGTEWAAYMWRQRWWLQGTGLIYDPCHDRVRLRCTWCCFPNGFFPSKSFFLQRSKYRDKNRYLTGIRLVSGKRRIWFKLVFYRVQSLWSESLFDLVSPWHTWGGGGWIILYSGQHHTVCDGEINSCELTRAYDICMGTREVPVDSLYGININSADYVLLVTYWDLCAIELG